MSEALAVFESNISINGEHIIAALGRSSAKLPTGTILSSSNGKRWKVKDNDLRFRTNFMKVIKASLTGGGRTALPVV